MTKIPFASVLLTASLAAACAENPESLAPESDELVAEKAHKGVAPLPCFEDTPNIAAAVAAALPGKTVVRAIYSTESGAQIYRCQKDAAGNPVWALRTPIAHLTPSKKTRQKLGDLAMAYHVRNDFGGLVSAAENTAMALVDAAGAPIFAPIWSFTFAPAGTPQIVEERETVAGRVLAQDVLGTGNIAHLFIEVRGRSVAGIADGIVLGASNAADTGEDPLASADYILRWNLVGGVAPAGTLCTEATLGTESQQAYAADYYFLETTP